MSRSTEPLVSICIPTRNRAHLVGAAIRSALEQTYSNLRVVVVDNCSSDGTAELLENFRRQSPERFAYVINPTDVGMQGNFTRCAELAEGKYFKILCSDDRAYPTLVEKQVAALEAHPSVVVATARRRRLSGSLLFRLYDPLLKMRSGLWRGKDAVRYIFRVSNMIGGSAQLMMRLDAFRPVGRYRDDPVVGNMFDIEPLLRLLAGGWDLYVSDEILCDYNSHLSSYTTATLTDPAIQEYFFAFREEQARDPLYAPCLRLPRDLEVSKRNSVSLLLLAGFAATFPTRDRPRAARLFDYVIGHYPALWLRALRRALEMSYYLPGGRAGQKPIAPGMVV